MVGSRGAPCAAKARTAAGRGCLFWPHAAAPARCPNPGHLGSCLSRRTWLWRELVAAVPPPRLGHLRRRQALAGVCPVVRQHLRVRGAKQDRNGAQRGQAERERQLGEVRSAAVARKANLVCRSRIRAVQNHLARQRFPQPTAPRQLGSHSTCAAAGAVSTRSWTAPNPREPKHRLAGEKDWAAASWRGLRCPTLCRAHAASVYITCTPPYAVGCHFFMTAKGIELDLGWLPYRETTRGVCCTGGGASWLPAPGVLHCFARQ